ncbi:pseudo-rSAM protein, GG-Bacteroidales system [Parabacteroides chinchillae]|uniref:Pseudo-rSAM protein, GG-Bacteroidales system n=2 Tax=Parabacteroides chinchillae TaxID=871327 RepID=A0A8G2BZ55_9BACT|nr:pseudo-rSAM protein, GG-Bacteroidales system [Parabacteroides chinchillae]
MLHDKNSLLDVLEFMKSNFDKIPKLSELSQASLLSSTRHIYNKMKKNLIEELVKSKNFIDRKDYLLLDPRIDSLKKKISLLVSNTYNNLGELLDIIDSSSYIPTISCTPFSFKLFVSADSKIHLCEKIGYKYPLGYIDINNIPQFDFESLAINYNKYYKTIACECLKCYNIYTCSTCLFERNFKCKKFSKEDYTKQLEYYTKNDYYFSYYYPYFTGYNKDFCINQLKFDLLDIFSQELDENSIFSRQLINSNFYGRLSIFPNGEIFSCINKVTLGNISSNSIKNIILEEMTENRNWFLTRKSVSPCSSCKYNILCPSISDFEIFMNYFSFCNLQSWSRL